jgi:DNA mismatch endonuclease (patch repair protein)
MVSELRRWRVDRGLKWCPMDIVTRTVRSRMMAGIRGHGNKNTELKLARLLRQSGLNGWRRRQALFGKPDFVFRSIRLVIFVDGCFWHGCSRHYNAPEDNEGFWRTKYLRNRLRDKSVNRKLRAEGWSVLRVWEHELAKPEAVVRRILRAMERAASRSDPGYR